MLLTRKNVIRQIALVCFSDHNLPLNFIVENHIYKKFSIENIKFSAAFCVLHLFLFLLLSKSDSIGAGSERGILVQMIYGRSFLRIGA